MTGAAHLPMPHRSSAADSDVDVLEPTPEWAGDAIAAERFGSPEAIRAALLPEQVADELMTDPKHFFRSFTVKELGRLMTARPTHLPTRAHEMGIYKRYFDLITSGRKTTEIRVNDSSRRKITKGSLIRFRCREEEVLTRVARYSNFEEMFDHESVTSVNPTATREEQLTNIRQIYPPEREALGVVAIGIELVNTPQ